MNRDAVIAKLNEHRAELQQLGVVSASLFGSVARGDETAASDIDIAVKLDPSTSLSRRASSRSWMASTKPI